MPCNFLLFQVSAICKVSFVRNLLFRQFLRTWVFLRSECLTLPTYFFIKEHSLKTSNKRTFIPLLIKQFVSLIELKMWRLIIYWTNTCKFKINQLPTQSVVLEERMTLVIISLYYFFNILHTSLKIQVLQT